MKLSLLFFLLITSVKITVAQSIQDGLIELEFQRRVIPLKDGSFVSTGNGVGIPPKRTSIPNQKRARDLTNSIDEIAKVVVKIEVESASGKKSEGTGFYVGTEGHVLTNYHVVFENGQPAKKINIRSTVPTIIHEGAVLRRQFVTRGAKILDTLARTDLALLQIPNSPFANSLLAFSLVQSKKVKIQKWEDYAKSLISLKPLVRGGRISVSGYPANQPVLITNSGYVSNLEGFTIAPNGQEYDYYVVDMPINHGNSGGPVYLSETGEIVGVAVTTIMPPDTVIKQFRGADNRLYMLQDVLKYDQNVRNVRDSTKREDVKRLFEIIERQRDYYQYTTGIGGIIPIQSAIPLLDRNKIKWR